MYVHGIHTLYIVNVHEINTVIITQYTHCLCILYECFVILSGLKPICEEGGVRLTEGTDNTTGRLEVCEYGRWGSVCSYKFDNKDAIVACKQLGYYDVETFTR